MSSLLQLPGDIWRDIIVSFLGSVKEIVRLDLSLLSTNERVTFRRCFHESRHFSKFSFSNHNRGLIRWCGEAGLLPARVTFETGFVFDGCASVTKVVSKAQVVSCETCTFESDDAFNTVLESCSAYLETLDITNCRGVLTMDSLSACKQLTSLHLWNCNNIRDETLTGRFSYLEKLRFCSLNFCGNLKGKSVNAFLKNCPNLGYLTITGHHQLEEALTGLTGPYQLRSFIVEKCNLTGLSVQLVANLMPELRFLHLHTPNYSVQDADIDLLVRNCPAIHSLELTQFSAIGDASLVSIATHLKTLHKLQLVLDSQSTVSDQGVIAFGNGLPMLEELTIANCHSITDSSIRVIGAQCTKLRQLSVQNCVSITDRAFDTVVSRELTRLDVSGTRICGVLNDALLRDDGEDSFCILTCDHCHMLTDAFVNFVVSRRLYFLSLCGCDLPRSFWFRFSELTESARIKIVDISYCDRKMVQMFKGHAPASMTVTARGI